MTDPQNALFEAYLAGELAGKEAVAFARLIENADQETLANMKAEMDGTAAMEMAITPRLKAPPRSKIGILAKVHSTAQIVAPSDLTEDYSYIRENEGWRPFLVPGTYVKTLFTHPRADGHNLFLLKMDPGVHFPEHPHDGIEECLLVSGDMETEGVILGPGDYVRARAGTHHGGLSTKRGCVCLLIMSKAA